MREDKAMKREPPGRLMRWLTAIIWIIPLFVAMSRDAREEAKRERYERGGGGER